MLTSGGEPLCGSVPPGAFGATGSGTRGSRGRAWPRVWTLLPRRSRTPLRGSRLATQCWTLPVPVRFHRLGDQFRGGGIRRATPPAWALSMVTACLLLPPRCRCTQLTGMTAALPYQPGGSGATGNDLAKRIRVMTKRREQRQGSSRERPDHEVIRLPVYCPWLLARSAYCAAARCCASSSWLLQTSPIYWR